MNIDDPIWLRLVELVRGIPSKAARHAGHEPPLSPRTDLVADLGLVGDDAFEFMERYAECFGVAQGDFHLATYFEPEGLSLLPLLRRRPAKRPITLGMLALAAQQGYWNTEGLEQARREAG